MPDSPEIGAPPAPVETNAERGAERPLIRDKVVNAFKYGINRFETALRDPGRTSNVEQQWALQSILKAKDSVNIDDKTSGGTFENTFTNDETGETFTQQEGIPVENLIKFLEEEAATATNAKERKKLRETIKTLKRASKTFEEAHGNDPAMLRARTKQEANLISQDARNTYSMDGDWTLAEETLRNRRELIIPPPTSRTRRAPATTETGTETTTAETTTLDTPTQFEIDIISIQEAIDKLANDQARKRVAEFLREGRWFNLLRWPAKIGVRLGEGGAVQMVTERIRREMINNNTSFMRANQLGAAINQLDQERGQALASQQAQVNRFKAGNIERGGPQDRREERVAIQGQLKNEIINNILRPIDQGTITTPDQVRAALAEFVRTHPNDTQIQALFGPNASDFGGRAEYFATDILEMGLKIKESRILHEASTEQIDQAIKINFGLAREAYNTDTRTLTDRLAAAARKRNVRGGPGVVRVANAALGATLLNPVVVGAAASLGVNGALRAAGWTARAADLPSLVTGAGFGAVVTGARRGVEIGRDNQTHRAERAIGEQIEARPHSNNPVGRFIERLSGGYRREDLEKFRYDAATVTNLINGEGNELIGDENNPTVRRSITELRGLDLTDPANREAVASRIAEIQTRLTRGQQERRDLVEYTRRELVNQEKNQLYEARDQLRQSLFDSGMSNADLTDLINRFNDQWNAAIDRDVRNKNLSFLGYRTRQVAGAAAFGGAMGLAGGLAARGVIGGARWVGENTGIGTAIGGATENVGRAVSTSPVAAGARTVGEKVQEGWNNKPEVINNIIQPIDNVTKPVREAVGQKITELRGTTPPPVETKLNSTPRIYRETVKNLFDKPGNLQIKDNLQLAVDGSDMERRSGFLNAAGERIDWHQTNITPEGNVVVSGSLKDLNPDVQQALSSWEQVANNTPEYNINTRMAEIIQSGKPEVIRHGNFIISLNSGPNGQMSMMHYSTGIETHGFIHEATKVPGSTQLEISIDDTFGSNKNLTPDQIKSFQGALAREGWVSDLSERKIPVPEQILGSDGKWKEMTTNVERQWYSYNTPVADNNELRLHTFKEGNGVSLNADWMEISRQSELNPESVNVQDVIKEGKLGFAFTLPGQIDNPIIVNDWSDGRPAEGILHLDINDTDPNHFVRTIDGKTLQLGEFSKWVVNQQALSTMPDGDIATEYNQRYDVWQLNGGQGRDFGTISAGRLVDGPNGQKVWQSFALIRGNGDTPTSLPGEIPERTLTILPPQATEFKPPLAPPIVPPPTNNEFFIPPIPMAPRHPLPPMKERRIPYGRYGDQPDAERYRLFDLHRSPILRENPTAKLDPFEEVESYFERQNPKYQAEIENLASQINQPLSPTAKAIVCIPVAGHQEGGNIYQSLMNYTYQDAAKDQYEILLFVNYPEVDREGNPIRPDNTMQEIEKFRRDHPDMPVRVVSKVMPPQQARITYIRKYLNDVALLRHHQRGRESGDIVLISNDADNTGIAPTYISNFINKFDQNPHADAMLGQLDWDPEAYTKYPLVHFGTRLFQHLNAIGRHGSGRMISSGANSAFRGSIYAGIGGYIPEISHGEDIAIGQAIVAARGDHTRIQYGGARVSRLYTSARRAVDALNTGYVPVVQWDKGFSAFDDEVRRLQLGEGQNINYEDPRQVERLKRDLEVVINKTLDTYEEGENIGKDAHYYKQALRYLGVQYELRNGEVSITNMDRIAKNLQHYQKMGVLLRDIKAGKGTPEMRAELRRLQEGNQADQELERVELRRIIGSEEEDVERQLDVAEEIPLVLPDIPPLRYELTDLEASDQKREAGDYILCLDKPLGSGGMGTVVAGYNKNTGQLLAFKRVNREEQKSIAEMNHYPEGVEDIEDLIKDEIDNPTLGVYLDKLEQEGETIKIYPMANVDLDNYMERSGPLTKQQALLTTIKVMTALKDMHRNGLLHLDLSPTNILVSPEGIRITDFNAGSIQNGQQNRYNRGFVGGFRYMTPPELFEENSVIDETADTYEASVLLYKLMTNIYPYIPADGISAEEKAQQLKERHQSGQFEIPDTVPESVKRILQKGINPDPNNRYQSANQMLNDLLRAYNAVDPGGLEGETETTKTEESPTTPTTPEVISPNKSRLGRLTNVARRGASAIRNRIKRSPRPATTPATPSTPETSLPPDRPFTVPLGGTLNIQSERQLTPDEQTLLSDKYSYITLRQAEGAKIDEILNEVRTNDERFQKERRMVEVENYISRRVSEGVTTEQALDELRTGRTIPPTT